MNNKSELILRQVYQLFDLSKREWHQMRAENGVTLLGMPLVKALPAIEANPGVKPSELATVLNIRPQSITGLIDKLVAEGFVERRLDTKDRRAFRLFITKAGQEAKEKANESLKTAADSFFIPLDETEKEHLLRLLQKVIDHHV